MVERLAQTPRLELPPMIAVPYRSELLQAVALLVNQWSAPAFHADVIAEVDGDLGVHGAEVLTALAATEALRPSDIADLLTTGASNVSKILKYLEDKHYVERVTDRHDARVVWVRLTEAGGRVARLVMIARDTMFDRMMTGWELEEIATYLRLTKRLTAAGADYMERLDEEAEVLRRAVQDYAG